ncbi:plastocyanin/azurin family copper-binding protein [Bradyrhizobium ganzhouense]|uniref:plastocyanin/azurin family copper-binding protein n=1 Tax=Bradyrhizobium ganzhouense TaxID=1179767 RepID=UPI003CF79C63
MLPDGAAPFVGKNGEDMSVKFDQAGIYGVKCVPHYAMGMVAMIVVGAPTNIEQAKAVPQAGKAKQMFATLFEKLEAVKPPLQVGEARYVGPAPSQRPGSRDVLQLPRSSCWG